MPDPVRTPPLTVLLIEDNPGDARLIRELLREGEDADYTLEHVERLVDGLLRLAAGDVDLVLLDLSLPDAYGFETFSRVHTQVPDVPIVVLTGLADDELARRAVQEGAQDYLPKGEVNAHGLVRAIRYAIERAQLLARVQAARAEAEAERARITTVLHSAAHAIVFVDATTRHLTINPAAERLLARPLDPAQGPRQYVGQICRPDGQPLVEDELLSSRALRGETVTDEELLVRRPDGSQVPILGSAAPVRDSTGRIIGAITIHQDITTLKELERLRDEWTSAIAHDLRQPVGAIGIYAELLESWLAEHPSADGRAMLHVQHIRTATGQLDRMISDLLDVSRLGAGRLVLNPVPVELGRLVQGIVERAADLTRGHVVQIEIAGPLPKVHADPGRLEQVLVNLLSNAAKYGSSGTPIVLSIEPLGHEVQIAVTNQGEGISPEDLPHVFTRFFRAQGAREGGVPGLGLGLYVCHELVSAHGGRIWVESTPPTTTFHVALPLGRPAATGDRPPG